MVHMTEYLKYLQGLLFDHYAQYKKGNITETEYLSNIKPIDHQIDKIELASLKHYICKKSELDA